MLICIVHQPVSEAKRSDRSQQILEKKKKEQKSSADHDVYVHVSTKEQKKSSIFRASQVRGSAKTRSTPEFSAKEDLSSSVNYTPLSLSFCFLFLSLVFLCLFHLRVFVLWWVLSFIYDYKVKGEELAS